MVDGHARALPSVYKVLWVVLPSHDALQVSTLLGVVAPFCAPLRTRRCQLPTLFSQQCWELLRPFARSFSVVVIWRLHRTKRPRS